MRILDRYTLIVRSFLPSPFSIALILTAVSFLIVWCFQFLQTGSANVIKSLDWWNSGLWNTSMLEFAMQMMIMLVLGHALALAPSVRKLIERLSNIPKNTAQAASLVALCAMLTALFNWGLGLIFGAILAKTTAKSLHRKKIPFNYGIIGAAGYAGLMIWHSGISGSALIKTAEPGSIKLMMAGLIEPNQKYALPNLLPLTDTVFTIGNILTVSLILLMIPMALYWLGRNLEPETSQVILSSEITSDLAEPSGLIGAERIDHNRIFPNSVGILLMVFCIYKAFLFYPSPLQFFVPNNINLLLFALAIGMHTSINHFLGAIEQAIIGASGILIQFPLYFGVMGLIKESGLVAAISDFFVATSNQRTLPLFTYISAGIVNMFVPSGGGQWAVQGPIIIKSALDAGIPISKGVLALAYGDQVTNMLQPFWALPLLGITKLSARDILPFTAIMFIVGFIIYGLGILCM